MKKFLVLGGGFGGVYAALEFEKRLADDADIEITLVNRDNFFLFTPMLHEVAASDLDVTHIVTPSAASAQREFFDGHVEASGSAGAAVIVSHGRVRHTHDLAYDHLVMALGLDDELLQPARARRAALTMKSLSDAIALRNRLIAHLEEADSECAAGNREPLLTFVVAGGGLRRRRDDRGHQRLRPRALRSYPRIARQGVRMVLVHARTTVLPELSEKLGRTRSAS